MSLPHIFVLFLFIDEKGIDFRHSFHQLTKTWGTFRSLFITGNIQLTNIMTKMFSAMKLTLDRSYDLLPFIGLLRFELHTFVSKDYVRPLHLCDSLECECIDWYSVRSTRGLTTPRYKSTQITIQSVHDNVQLKSFELYCQKA